MERKKAEEREKTHGAERISGPRVHALYDVAQALDRCCFDGYFKHILPTFYYIPPDIEAAHSEARGVYIPTGGIMIRRSDYDVHGIDDDMINTIYHEMVHFYDDMKRIQDTKDGDGVYHTAAFAASCQKNGGICWFSNSVTGFSRAALTPETLAAVKALVRRWVKTDLDFVEDRLSTWAT